VTNYLHPERSHLTVERLIMPLSLDGDPVRIILVMNLFHAPSEAEPRPQAEIIADLASNEASASFRAYVF